MVLLLIGCVEIQESEGVETFEEAVTEARVDIGTGDVRVVGDDTATSASFRWRKRWTTEEPLLAHDLQDGVLTILDDSDDVFATVDIDLTVPTGTMLLADLGTGDLVVRHLAGDVEVEVGTGDTWIEDVAGTTTANLGTGDLDGVDLVGAVVTDVGTGDTRIGLAVPVETRADAGTGDIDLVVPPGTYHLVLDAGVGSERVTGVEEGEGPTLQLSTGTGDLRVSVD